MQGSYDSGFQNFFRWLFEMGKAIAALNNSVAAGAVRTVPLNVGAAAAKAAKPPPRPRSHPSALRASARHAHPAESGRVRGGRSGRASFARAATSPNNHRSSTRMGGLSAALHAFP